MKTWVQLAQEQSKIFELAVPLIIGETYTISMNSYEPFIISVGDVFVGETVDGSLEFIATNSGDVMITSYSDISMEFEIKLELGSRTEWSPAPEDGYNLNLPNGAYHIQGGNSFSNTVENGIQAGVNTYAWSDIALNGIPLPINDIERYREDSNKLEFTGTNLDFIAADPVISTQATPEYRSQSYEQHSTISPISQVQVYWDDVSAFEAGDDTMSTIIINTPWATRNSTDYIYSILGGYQYKPTQGSQVYADPAIQLGDTFTYGDTNQLVASVVWYFDGSVTGDFNAPQNNDSNLDDPRSILIQNEFKKKISLGDSYQGVTIDRENGIQMLLSPDGTLDNAIGRFYADLTRGLAFQYRDTSTDTWRDWLYFDKAEAIFKLALYNTSDEVDAKIELSVENISHGNLLTNGSGELGFLGWKGGSVAKYVKEILEARTTDLRYLENLRYNIGFVPMYNPMSLSEWDISFYNNGFDVSPIAFIVPNIDHSYRAKVSKFKPFNIDVLEFNDLNRANSLTANKVTNFAFTSPMDYVQFTFTPSSTTQFVRFKYNRTGITTSDRLNIAEVMFNRGQPKEWQPSPNNASVYSHSIRTQLGGQITEVATEVDRVSNDIHNTTVDISARDGVQIKSTSGTGLRITNASGNDTITLNTNGTLNAIGGTFQNITATGGTFQNITVTGNLTAGTIAGLQFNNSKITFPNGKLGLSSATNSMEFGNFRMLHGLFEDQGGGLTIDGMTFSQGSANSTGGIYIQQGKVNINTDLLTAEVIGDPLGAGPTIHNAKYSIGLNSSLVSFYRDSNNFVRTTPVSGLMAMNNDLGSPTERIDTIHLNNQPNVASDIRYKYDIQDIDPLLVEIIGREVKPKQYRTQFDDKIHFGYIAQDVERALYKYCGHDKDKYAMLSKSESYMSLLYGELNVIMDAYNRQENERLSDRISKLERLINDDN